ncbi:MAG: hypothetical protein ACR2L2_10675 [Acidobacteriota bacterium]
MPYAVCRTRSLTVAALLVLRRRPAAYGIRYLVNGKRYRAPPIPNK